MEDAEGMAALLSRFAGDGRLDWIGVRPERLAQVRPLDETMVGETGLEGDRQARANARTVTLIQAEHLPVIAALAGVERVAPEVLRRNLMVSGLNLIALRRREIVVGEAVLRLTVPCAPCSRMEEAIGQGGYNAMRGHGGWCAEVVQPGRIRIGDAVRPVT